MRRAILGVALTVAMLALPLVFAGLLLIAPSMPGGPLAKAATCLAAVTVPLGLAASLVAVGKAAHGVR